MVFKSILGAVCACLIVVSFNVNSALVSRLGGLAYYDTEADLTWLADANAGAGSAYDTWIPGSGLMDWVDANNWAANLVVVGVGGWRLADTVQPDASCDTQNSTGFYGYDCTGSEMGNLFYNVLGGSAGSSIVITHNASYDLFSNVQSNYYWSATEYPPNTSLAWFFDMDDGEQGYLNKGINFYAWAVHSGDVSAVPIPASLWLFGSGLLALVGVARRKKA